MFPEHDQYIYVASTLIVEHCKAIINITYNDYNELVYKIDICSYRYLKRWRAIRVRPMSNHISDLFHETRKTNMIFFYWSVCLPCDSSNTINCPSYTFALPLRMPRARNPLNLLLRLGLSYTNHKNIGGIWVQVHDASKQWSGRYDLTNKYTTPLRENHDFLPHSLQPLFRQGSPAPSAVPSAVPSVAPALTRANSTLVDGKLQLRVKKVWDEGCKKMSLDKSFQQVICFLCFWYYSQGDLNWTFRYLIIKISMI